MPTEWRVRMVIRGQGHQEGFVGAGAITNRSPNRDVVGLPECARFERASEMLYWPGGAGGALAINCLTDSIISLTTFFCASFMVVSLASLSNASSDFSYIP